jgi:diacylglycerol kinase (ATP)
MRVAAILGPGAGDGTLRRFRAPEVELSVIVELHPADNYDAVLILGGDGSIHRQLRALQATHTPLLVVPAGSGNDFARELRLTTVRRAWRAWRKFLSGAGNVRGVDLGVIRELGPDSSSAGGRAIAGGKCHYFCCIAGAGLDADANRRANQMPAWLRAHGGYVVAAVREMATYRFPRMRVEIDQPVRVGEAANPRHVDPDRLRFDQPTTLVVLANGRSYGDGMRMAPLARLDDGLLDVCYVRKTQRHRLLRFFPTVFAGRHLHLPEVSYVKGRCVGVQSDPPADVYADGEFVCRTPIEVRVQSQALRIIV